MDVTVSQQRPLQVTELVEAEERMVTGALEIFRVRRSLLLTVGLTDRAIHIENDLVDRLGLMDAVDPCARHVVERLQVRGLRKDLCLEATHFAGRCRRLLAGSPTNDLPHRRVHTQLIGVVEIFVTTQPAVDRLSQGAINECCVLLPVRTSVS